MKKQFSIVAIISIITLTVVYSGCKKKDTLDTTKPVVTLNGLSVCYLQRGTIYVDADATALDNKDGTINVVSSGLPNINAIGTYTETYTATDKAGNVGTASRTIYVVDITGLYTVVRKSPYPVVGTTVTTTYNDGLTLVNDLRGEINHSNFDNFSSIYLNSFLSSGSTDNLPSQTVNLGDNITFAGSASITMIPIHSSIHDTTELIFNYTTTDTTFVLHSRAVYKKAN